MPTELPQNYQQLYEFNASGTSSLYNNLQASLPHKSIENLSTGMKLKIKTEYDNIVPEFSKKPSRIGRLVKDHVKESEISLETNSKSTNSKMGESSALIVPSETKSGLVQFHNEISKSMPQHILELNIGKKLSKPKQKWHPPWELCRVISGHTGWVQSIAVEPNNEWFATGANDRLIKIWDLAKGTLKLTLTGHINSVKSLAISRTHPYMFSCSDDNRIKCWDLEQNKVIRDYHGHLSGICTIDLHPTLNILFSGGRDAVVRVWDIRTRSNIFVLSGHRGTIHSIKSQNSEPQIVSGSQDKHVRTWDLAAGKCKSVLTNHKKSIRTLSIHPQEYSFATCGGDNIKAWRCPEAEFMRNFAPPFAIPLCSAITTNEAEKESSLVVGSNDGTLAFYDWETGVRYQKIKAPLQPGTLECEAGILGCTFDMSETRLLTAESDKTIKVWKQNFLTTPEAHPCEFESPINNLRY